MRILIVCSGTNGHISPFVQEQADSISSYGNEVHIFPIKEKGVLGYLKSLPDLKHKIKEFSPAIIHAHYGLSGLLACFQIKVPVVITFHNGETLSRVINFLSSIATFFSKCDIYVAHHIYQKLYFKKNEKYNLIPCGVDLATMNILEKAEAKHELKISDIGHNILFGGPFSHKRKNAKLAQTAIKLLSDYNINLIELKGFSRTEVNLLLNSCDLALLTSISEGSPQFIKEAMACNCPIVATDVGDVKELISGIEGCYISSFDPRDVANKIVLALKYSNDIGRTNGRERIIALGLDSNTIAKKILELYDQILCLPSL